jgi:hypothetical protein
VSMSTYICGIKPPDERWVQMDTIWKACEDAGIAPPTEVYDFFGGDTPDPKGVVVPFQTGGGYLVYTYIDGVEEIRKGSPNAGFIVDITKLPPDIKLIRFENSW